MLGFNYKKSVQALNFYAIREGGGVNKMKSLKLIWLADRLHIRKYGRPILNDVYFALNYGPVASHTKDLIEDTNFLSKEESEYRNLYIVSIDKYDYGSKSVVNKEVFSQTDMEVMLIISEIYGKYNAFQLSEESHKYPEWKKFESHLKSKSSSRFEMNYEDFFIDDNVEENSALKISEESLDLSRELFKENGYIYRLI